MSEEKTEPTMIQEPTEKGLQIDNELSKLLEVKSEWEIDDIRSIAPQVYETIFDNYDEEEENGITTDNFSFIESKDESEVFILKAK
jgi:hypothetical protein